jgi:hypothetical protein
MSEYSCYFLDSGGHIAAAHRIDAGDDEEAREQGRQILAASRGRASGCELWRFGCFLGQFRPEAS